MREVAEDGGVGAELGTLPPLASLPAAQTGLHPSGEVEVLVRPRWWLLALFGVVPVLLFWQTMAEFDRGRFDIRLPLYSVGLCIWLVVRAQTRGTYSAIEAATPRA